ncbi:MAG TPA: lipid II flippase MurJ, partial [Acidimicrobiales bacterium]|nr:lipid II flippase MurJ [Acidimicrobiales bacterium]
MTTDVAEAASPPDRRSGRAAVLMASGTALSRLTGLARLAVAAYALGFGSLADVFNLANTMPNIVHDLVLDGVLSATFVPVFVHELATRDRDEAVESIAAVVTLSAVLLAISTVIFIAIAPLIASLYFGGNGDSQGVATELLVLFAPQLLCYGTISLITALLNTERRFAAPMFVPILNNLIAIATLVVFAHMSHGSATSTHAIGGARLFLLGAGTTIAVAVQALALLPSMIRSRFRLRPVWRPHDPAVRSILRLSGWTFGFVVANQIAMFVVLVLAAKLETLEHGAVSVYTYGFTFFQLPFGIIAVSVMSAISPELTELYSRKDLAGFRSRFGSGTRQILGLIVPSAVGYLILAPSLMTL